MSTAVQDAYDPVVPVVEAVRAGDRHAFAELVRREHRWVRGVVFGVLGDVDRTDDVVQQVWAVAWQRIDTLRDAARWRAWLYRIARNTALDAGRETSRRRDRDRVLRSERPRPVSSSTPDRDAESAERHGAVLAAIGALPPLYREPFVLRHLSGWGYRRIADVMAMPVDTVETRLVRARRLLRTALKDKV